MTPVKPQISKFQAEESCQVNFNVLRRFYSRAFVERVKSSVHVSVLSVCIANSLTGHIFYSHVLKRKCNALTLFIIFKLVAETHNNKSVK